MQDQSYHRQKSKVFKKGGHIIDDARLLIVRINVDLSLGIILIRSRMALPACSWNVVNVDGGSGIAGGENVMDAMTAGTVGSCPGAELHRNAMKAVLKGSNLLHFNAVFAHDLLFFVAMLAGFDDIDGIDRRIGVCFCLNKMFSVTARTGWSIENAALIKSHPMDAVDILPVNLDMTLTTSGGHSFRIDLGRWVICMSYIVISMAILTDGSLWIVFLRFQTMNTFLVFKIGIGFWGSFRIPFEMASHASHFLGSLFMRDFNDIVMTVGADFLSVNGFLDLLQVHVKVDDLPVFTHFFEVLLTMTDHAFLNGQGTVE